jgi:hypothetical protein
MFFMSYCYCEYAIERPLRSGNYETGTGSSRNSSFSLQSVQCKRSVDAMLNKGFKRTLPTPLTLAEIIQYNGLAKLDEKQPRMYMVLNNDGHGTDIRILPSLKGPASTFKVLIESPDKDFVSPHLTIM